VSLDQLSGRRECVDATISTDKELTLESVKDFREQRESASGIFFLSFSASAGFSLELALPCLRTLSSCCNPFTYSQTISYIFISFVPFLVVTPLSVLCSLLLPFLLSCSVLRTAPH
jgi:hypothetical protein